MLLPASDLGLITSHLMSHDGMMMKLKHFAGVAEDEKLKELLNKKLGVMRSHVRIMMEMIDPDKSDFAALPQLDQLPGEEFGGTQQGSAMQDKHIAMEMMASAQAMAKDNFFSALKMKDPKVKKVHMEMAHQQVEIAQQVSEFLKEKGAEIIPLATSEEQRKVMKHFSHVIEE